MKIVIWISDKAHQKALVSRIHALFPVHTIVVESKRKKSIFNFSLIYKRTLDKLLFSSVSGAWKKMLRFYHLLYPAYPAGVNILTTKELNSKEVYDTTMAIAPDLIIVSGTSLVKEKLLSIKPSIGILNLHTGLSPYINGGPNCTNWCIALEEFHLIGNTVMWIDAGIDSGNIICTELTRFTGNESLYEIHLKVMEHAHQLYLNCISKVLAGNIAGISQKTLPPGRTFYTKHWNRDKKLKLTGNLKKFKTVINSEEYKRKQTEVKTIQLT